MEGCNQSFFSGIIIQGTVNADHNSTYGVRIRSAQDIVFAGVNIGGSAYATSGVYLDKGFGDCTNVSFIGCSLYSAAKAADGSSYAPFQTTNGGSGDAFLCTLAELTTYFGIWTPGRHQRFYVSNAPDAPVSQVYNAEVVGTGAHKATVWYDVANSKIRYG